MRVECGSSRACAMTVMTFASMGVKDTARRSAPERKPRIDPQTFPFEGNTDVGNCHRVSAGRRDSDLPRIDPGLDRRMAGGDGISDQLVESGGSDRRQPARSIHSHNVDRRRRIPSRRAPPAAACIHLEERRNARRLGVVEKLHGAGAFEYSTLASQFNARASPVQFASRTAGGQVRRWTFLDRLSGAVAAASSPGLRRISDVSPRPSPNACTSTCRGASETAFPGTGRRIPELLL